MVGAGADNSLLCQSILLSIANPRVYHSALHTGWDSHEEFGLSTFPKFVILRSEAAPEGKRLSPFLFPLNATTGKSAIRLAYPKNLTIRFGTHRASIYGGTAAAKTKTLTASSKDPVRESHTRELISRPVHPKILEEEFPEYQTLLDNMQVELSPITLPNIPVLGPSPFASYKNTHSRVNLEGEGEGEVEDTSAYGNGTIPSTRTTGYVQPNSTRQDFLPRQWN